MCDDKTDCEIVLFLYYRNVETLVRIGQQYWCCVVALVRSRIKTVGIPGRVVVLWKTRVKFLMGACFLV